METRHIIENGKEVTDCIDSENYGILDMTETHITLKHIPKGRRKQKEDWRLPWPLFLKKCKSHELRVNGYGYDGDQGYSDEYYILELVIKNIIQEIQLLKTHNELKPYKEKYERISELRKKRRRQLNENYIKVRREKRKALENDINIDKQREELKKEIELLRDMASNETDQKKANQYAAEADYLNEQLTKLK